MNLIEAQNIAQKHVSEHLDSSWTFKWNRRKTAFGLCDHYKREIQLSRPLTETEDEEAVRQTILHEIAHALAGPREGHGPRWKSIARSIGVRRPASRRSFTGTTAESIQYSWALMYDGELIRGYHRRPGANTIRNVDSLYIAGRPETKGKLKLVQLS